MAKSLLPQSVTTEMIFMVPNCFYKLTSAAYDVAMPSIEASVTICILCQ